MADLTKLDGSTPAHEAAPLPVWRAAFLTVLGAHGNVSEAAAAAGISRGRAYQVRQANPDFAADWDAALEVASDALEREAWRRAIEGGRSYKFHPKTGEPLEHPERPGEPYYEMVYSDALLTLLLKAHRPDKYKDRSAVDVNATVTAKPAYDLDKLSLDEKRQLLELSRKALTDGNATQ